jgi:hypothetical protein
LPGVGIWHGLEETPLDRLDGPVAFFVVLCGDIGEAKLREFRIAWPAERVLCRRSSCRAVD